VALGRYLIRMFTGPGDLVLDNAFGSGSFLVAALLEGRDYIGIEKNEEVHKFKAAPIDYMEVAAMRLEEAKRLQAIKAPPSMKDIEPAARAATAKRRGLIDVDQVIGPALLGTVR
jgi:site-specific DNA-methyltransferase (adenine-specific)/modification methylase